MLASTRRASRAYGRVAMTFSCARRSFDAATIFMAFVICWVDFTARTRRRMSISEGTNDCSCCFSCRRRRRRELFPEVFERTLERGLDLIVQDLLLDNAGEHAGVTGFEESIQPFLVGPQFLDRHAVKVAIGRGEDDRHLLLD